MRFESQPVQPSNSEEAVNLYYKKEKETKWGPFETSDPNSRPNRKKTEEPPLSLTEHGDPAPFIREIHQTMDGAYQRPPKGGGGRHMIEGRIEGGPVLGVLKGDGTSRHNPCSGISLGNNVNAQGVCHHHIRQGALSGI